MPWQGQHGQQELADATGDTTIESINTSHTHLNKTKLIASGNPPKTFPALGSAALATYVGWWTTKDCCHRQAIALAA